ncbi:MAG: hypothetical protein R2854_31295 [Caldilineaceae bacterium]
MLPFVGGEGPPPPTIGICRETINAFMVEILLTTATGVFFITARPSFFNRIR